MRTHRFRVNDPVRFFTSKGKKEGFITSIRGAKADVVTADGSEFRVSLPGLYIRKGIAPKRVLTKEQKERLAFNIGDIVSFTSIDGKKLSGFVQRLHARRARIQSDDWVWNVPFYLLEKENADEQALKNKRRLEKIAIYADRQLKKHGLFSWRFCYDNAVERCGLCSYDDKVISMSEQFCLRSKREDIKDTVLHEIAHALVGQEHGHDAVWRTKALEIGCNGETTHRDRFVPPNFIMGCKYCGWHSGRNQRNDRLVCNNCRAPVTYELYTPKRWPSYNLP